MENKKWKAKKETQNGNPQIKNKIKYNKLGLSCTKLSLASAKLHTSLISDQHKLASNKLCSTILTMLAEALLGLKTTSMGLGGGWGLNW